jgi:hypothetical protein
MLQKLIENYEIINNDLYFIEEILAEGKCFGENETEINIKVNNNNAILLRNTVVPYKYENIVKSINSVDTQFTNENKKNTNKGIGAGGSNTNYYGKNFEDKTNNEKRLIEMGFFTNPRKTYNYLSKTYKDKTIVFVTQCGLRKYIKNKYNIDIFRLPDEAYIIEYNNGQKTIKILEKKEQRVEGSVETKLWSGPSLKREYELVLGKDFEVHYGFCVSDFLKKKFISNEKKYTILNTILNENNISILFGDDDNYFQRLDKWLNF